MRISIHALLAESDWAAFIQLTAARLFLSTLSLRRATANIEFAARCTRFLSTLSLRRATSGCPHRCQQTPDFYPRSPCGERPIKKAASSTDLVFLSTLSLRRATLRRPATRAKLSNFYPRSPCGERLNGREVFRAVKDISIHALLAESDAHKMGRDWLIDISIHALLAESDPL